MRQRSLFVAFAVTLSAFRPAVAQNESAAQLKAKLDYLQAELDTLRSMRASLTAGNLLLVPGGMNARNFEMADAHELGRVLSQRVSNGSMTQDAVEKFLKSVDELTKSAVNLIEEELRTKDSLYTELRSRYIDAGTVPLLLRYQGNVSGRYSAKCKTVEGGSDENGGASFYFTGGGGRVEGKWGEGSVKGTVLADGTVTGTIGGPLGGANWSGRLTAGSDGVIRGSGSITPQAGSKASCTGSWSIP